MEIGRRGAGWQNLTEEPVVAISLHLARKNEEKFCKHNFVEKPRKFDLNHFDEKFTKYKTF